MPASCSTLFRQLQGIPPSFPYSLPGIGHLVPFDLRPSPLCLLPGGHIPYRDSKLTRILQPSLGGNARTAIICTVNPAAAHVDETHNTLRFACRAKRVVNKAAVNEVRVSDRGRTRVGERRAGGSCAVALAPLAWVIGWQVRWPAAWLDCIGKPARAFSPR